MALFNYVSIKYMGLLKFTEKNFKTITMLWWLTNQYNLILKTQVDA